MNKDRLEKLARWWNEASSQLENGDSETLKHKFHLMEAELRIALKAEPERSWRIPPILGVIAIAVVVATLGVFAGIITPRPDTTGTIISARESAVTGIAEEEAALLIPLASLPDSHSDSQKALIPTQHSPSPQAGHRVVIARSPRPPVVRRFEPVTSQPAEQPTTTPTTTAPAPTPDRETEPPLDALALLVTLEREFEQ